MIITCEECSTKFNLDESILKKGGSKVRCTICRHVFTAYPHVDALPPETALPANDAETATIDPAHGLTPQQPTDSSGAIQAPPPPSEPADELKFEDDIQIDDDDALAMEGDLGEDLDLDDELSVDFTSDDADLNLDFSMDDEDMDFSDVDSPADDIHAEATNEVEIDDVSLDSDIQTDSAGMESSEELDMDNLALDNGAADPKSTTGQDLELKLEEGTELDLDFTLDDEPPEGSTETSQDLKLELGEGTELELDFTLDDDIPEESTETGQDLNLQLEEGTELELDFTLDDDTPEGSTETGQDLKLELEEGTELEMDLDFSADEDTPEAKSTTGEDLQLQLEEGSELDLDFSLDAEAEEPASQNLEAQLEEGTELDLDFSMDEPSSDPEDDLDMDFSIDEPSSDLESDLDLDFSMDASPASGNSRDIEETLELELEDDADLDLDFSVMENAMGQGQEKGDTEESGDLNLESDTAMDLDFSMGDDLSPEDAPFDSDTSDDELQGDSHESNMASNIDLDKKKATPVAYPQESTLSGERPPLFYELDQVAEESSFGIGKFILMILFLLVVAIAGYGAAIMTGVEIPYVSDIRIPYIEKYIPALAPAPEPPVKLKPLTTTTSNFLVNNTSGTLFAVKGEVLNQSTVPCKNVKIKGTLIMKDSKDLKTSVVLCGNMLSEKELKTMDITSVNTRLNSSDGSSAFIVYPGKKIPFLFVFSDSPDNIDTFKMTVTDFERMPKEK